jgi:hypothetical protein
LTAGNDGRGESAEIKTGEAVIVRSLGGVARREEVLTNTVGALLRGNPKGIVIGEEKLRVVAIRDGVRPGDGDWSQYSMS